jgi:uncharacterized protein (DUF58 family)
VRFVFTKLFYVLAALAFIPLSLSWGRPWLAWLAFAYDALLLAAAIVDARISRLPPGFQISREFAGRFAMGAETEVRLQLQNASSRSVSLIVKDEYPPQMTLSGMREARVHLDAQDTATLIYGVTPPRRGRFEFGQTALRFRSRFRLVWCQIKLVEPVSVKVYPNMRRAREAELKALGARSVAATHFVDGDSTSRKTHDAAVSDRTRSNDSDRTRCRATDDRSHRTGNKTRFGSTCHTGALFGGCASG